MCCCFISTGWRASGTFHSQHLIKCVSSLTRERPDWQSGEIRSVSSLIKFPVFWFFKILLLTLLLYVIITSTWVSSLLSSSVWLQQNNDEKANSLAYSLTFLFVLSVPIWHCGFIHCLYPVSIFATLVHTCSIKVNLPIASTVTLSHQASRVEVMLLLKLRTE